MLTTRVTRLQLQLECHQQQPLMQELHQQQQLQVRELHQQAALQLPAMLPTHQQGSLAVAAVLALLHQHPQQQQQLVHPLQLELVPPQQLRCYLLVLQLQLQLAMQQSQPEHLPAAAVEPAGQHQQQLLHHLQRLLALQLLPQLQSLPLSPPLPGLLVQQQVLLQGLQQHQQQQEKMLPAVPASWPHSSAPQACPGEQQLLQQQPHQQV
jgi:hypothetical protein